MIFQKAKRGDRKKQALLGFMLLVCLISGFLVYRYFTREQHCVMGVQADVVTQPNEENYRCFDTQAEVLAYISGGRIVLPPNYTQEDVWAAIEENNSYNATLEASGNE